MTAVFSVFLLTLVTPTAAANGTTTMSAGVPTIQVDTIAVAAAAVWTDTTIPVERETTGETMARQIFPKISPTIHSTTPTRASFFVAGAVPCEGATTFQNEMPATSMPRDSITDTSDAESPPAFPRTVDTINAAASPAGEGCHGGNVMKQQNGHAHSKAQGKLCPAVTAARDGSADSGGYQHCSDCIHCASKGPLLSSPACLDLQAKTTKLQAVVGVFLPLLPYFLCVLFCRPHFFKLPSIRSVETNATRPALFQLWSGGSVAQHATKLWGATLACRAAARWSKDSSTRRQARCANIRQGKKAKTCLPRRRSPMSDANPKVQKPRHTRRTSTAGTLTLFCAVAVLLLDSTATATTTITTTTTIATAFECPVGVRLALTPALYKQGRDAFKCATYIPNYAFCQDSETGCSPPGPLDGSWVAVTGVDSVVLKDMMYLESIGLAAFKQFGGSIELSGDLRALQKIGDEAFYKAPNGGGSLNIDLSGAQSLRTIGGQFFGQFQIGSITADGLFPKFQGCFQFKDSNSGQLAVIPPNAVVLTPALYKQGYNVYKDATCILEMGFYNRDDPITDKVVLEDLGQLTGIGENAFGNHGFKGTIIFQGKFPKLTTIGRYAFINKPQPTSLIDLKGADFPLLEIIPEYAFGSFSGTIRISGRFASLKEIGRSAFGGAGNADSFINLGGLPALTSVGLFAFDAFEGLLTIDCDDCELLTEIDGYAFRSVSNAASRISFTGLAQLQKIGEYAFQNYKGILNLQFDAIDHFNSFAVGINAFSGTSNTKSGVQLPYDFALLEDALEKDGFGGYVFIGNGTSTTSTTTTRTSTTATTTTTTTYPAGSECSVADNFRYSAAAAIDNTFCTDEPNICRFQCCAFNVTDTCRACDADTGSCYDHLQLSPAGAAIAAETTSTWQDTPLFSGKRYSPPRITLEDENCAVFRGSRCYPLTSSGASDIRFQLMWGTPSNADDDKFNYVGGPPPLGLSKPGEGQDDPGGVSVINALTGDISASPLRNGSYTLWLLVYDSAAVDPDEGSRPLGIPQVFDQAVFARWDFEVQPTPEFNLQKGSSRTRVGPEITDPTTIDGNTTFYAVGGTYKIAPLEVLQTTTFSTVGGTLDSLRYALNGSLPDGLFVKTTSGDILVTFDPSNEGETYTVDLDVIDVVDTIPFDGVYTCDCEGTGFLGDNCGKSRADAMMAESAEKSKKLIAVVVSSGSGLIFILGAVVYVCCKKRIAKKDALLALDTARKAYGLAPARQSQAPNRTVESVTNPAFVGITLTDGAAIGEASAALHSTDDEYGDFTAAVQAAAGVSTAPAPPPVPGTNSKFVAPTINLGDSLLAAKGLDVLLGIDPKTYMHARNKVKVIISEFAKRGTDEDRQNIVGLLDGTYVNPPDSGSGKVDSRERSCKEIMATSPAKHLHAAFCTMALDEHATLKKKGPFCAALNVDGMIMYLTPFSIL
eukprot:gene10387-28144_t